MNAEKYILMSFLAAGLAVPVVRAADAVAPGAEGQKATYGTIVGIVRNAAKLPVAGATITAMRLDGSATRATLSGSDGIYTFADVVPGAWSVTSQVEEYPETPALALQVAAGHATRNDIAMGGPAPVSISSNSAPLAPRAVTPSISPSRAAAMQHTNSVWARLKKGEPISWRDLAESRPQTPSTASLAVPPVAAFDRPVAGALDAPFPSPQPASAAPAKPAPTIPEALQAPDPAPAVDNDTPFAFGDFSWLNGSPRNNPVLDTKFFTPEVRFDTHFMTDFNQPVDHTMGGATESFRSGEFQLEQISVGGDFHWDNVRGRILTMNGLFATTTPRNDASAGVGQWDVRGAYKYISEGWGGYHFNVKHGLNVDAGIFVSYIGLFSYYNFDNWTYQPSFVSSNTPWFFNGLRIQYFPTNKLKIEPWIINGWQSYNRPNGRHGFGGQILWQPTENLKFVFNNYGNGTDTLGNPNRSRLHTDDSIEYRYYHKSLTAPGINQMAFTFTGDLGCEYGGGVSCHGGSGGPKQAFLGWMAYDRTWFARNKLALTLGGGQMNNPGRYLTLLPPINGADAVSGSPYFTANPGDKSHMWDATVNLQYMPKQYITWWMEAGYRHSDVPYWTGRHGITPPGGNTGSPGQFVCSAGGSAGTNDLATAETNCGGGLSSVWFPDLRHGQATLSAGVMVKF
jgi:Putative beta-barrel porin-2, OmpL-like. bbp2/Carboxypeptidase regulatory-like domain